MFKIRNLEMKIRRSSNVALHNAQPTVSIKYKKRIIRIFFLYLITSLICWLPLIYTIVYRLTSKIPKEEWFANVIFGATMCSSLSAVLNPFIFGFLSEPYRRIWSRCIAYKFFVDCCTSTKKDRNRSDQNELKNIKHNQTTAKLAGDAKILVNNKRTTASGHLKSANNVSIRSHGLSLKSMNSSSNNISGRRGGCRLNKSTIIGVSKRVSFKTDIKQSNDYLRNSLNSTGKHGEPVRGFRNHCFNSIDEVSIQETPKSSLCKVKDNFKKQPNNDIKANTRIKTNIQRNKELILRVDSPDKISLTPIDIENNLPNTPIDLDDKNQIDENIKQNQT